MADDYKYIIHPNGCFTAIKASTASRWAEARRLADIERAQPPTKAQRALARRAAKRKRGQAARRKESEA